MKVYFYKRSLEILEFEAKSWLSLRPGICVAHFLRKGRSRREARREEGRRGRGELLVLFSTIGLRVVVVVVVGFGSSLQHMFGSVELPLAGQQKFPYPKSLQPRWFTQGRVFSWLK